MSNLDPHMSNKKTAPKSNIEIIKGFRGDWGAINPVTKVIPNKKKARKEKHSKRDINQELSN